MIGLAVGRVAALRRRVRGDHRGQALVEFALIAPLLLILVLGVVDFARAWHAYQVVTDAAREGARIAVVNNHRPLVADSVNTTVRDALGRAGLDRDAAEIELLGVGGDTGTQAQVSITYPHSFMFLGPLLRWTTEQGSISLRTSFVMRNE